MGCRGSLAERQGAAIAAQRCIRGVFGRPEAIKGRRAAILRSLGGILAHLGGNCGQPGLSSASSTSLGTFGLSWPVMRLLGEMLGIVRGVESYLGALFDRLAVLFGRFGGSIDCMWVS